MKLVRSEFGHDYPHYRFGYCEHAIIENGDALDAVYDQGFLPYSLEPNVHDRFYMARSARVRLSDFELSSENRRIAKKFDGHFTYQCISAQDAKNNEALRALFIDYFRERHGEVVMPAERLNGILDTPLPLRVLTYRENGALVAAALEVSEDGFCHFWFSAYDLSRIRQSLGMWLMLDGARRAKEAGCEHYYLGTVYGERALYKTNLEPLEFWDGTHWNSDLSLLKSLARKES